MKRTSNWSLIGIPDQQGVLHVGGRAGTVYGPEAFRRVFRRMQGRARVQESLTEDATLDPVTGDIDANHRLAISLVSTTHAKTGISVVVGGGHDHGYTHLAGVAKAHPKQILGCINLDAHLDVRKPDPKISSGSPFFLALESGVIAPENFVEFGIQSHCNAPALWEYAEKKKIRVVPMSTLRHGKAISAFSAELESLKKKCDVIVVSLDLDAISQAYAPGVSAPQAEGFTASEALGFCEIAGREAKVASLGIFELNPEHDDDDKTARLAATCAFHFIEEKIS
ncbi:MAG: formimidoylglutamase [Bacteriovoracia bacterium]